MSDPFRHELAAGQEVIACGVRVVCDEISYHREGSGEPIRTVVLHLEPEFDDGGPEP